jgi:branched-chain amino acid transport system ATP-binding protein
MEELFAARAITKKFGELVAVDELCFEVYKGEILGLMGPNGAGKTTVFNLITGVHAPTTGDIYFENQNITKLPAWKRCRMGIGRTYQVPLPFERMTVFENVLTGTAFGSGAWGKAALKSANHTIELTGLGDRKNELAGKLSLLDRKRLELAKALATEPKLLLIDEVAAGLTEPEADLLFQIVKQINNEGITVIWVEHILKMMQGVDRLLVIMKGRNLCCGCLEDVMNNQDVHEAYLGVEA